MARDSAQPHAGICIDDATKLSIFHEMFWREIPKTMGVRARRSHRILQTVELCFGATLYAKTGQQANTETHASHFMMRLRQLIVNNMLRARTQEVYIPLYDVSVLKSLQIPDNGREPAR